MILKSLASPLRRCRVGHEDESRGLLHIDLIPSDQRREEMATGLESGARVKHTRAL